MHDPTTGGPHWAALDNHSVDQRGIPYRMMFSNYFVSRTGVDGDHRAYTVDIAPEGKLSYDKGFRDEHTGALGINFNRRNWPGSPDAGFYKPHSMVWVCPPGVCTDGAAPAVRAVAASSASSKSCRTSLTVRFAKIKGKRITGGNVRFNGKTYKAKKNKKTGVWSVKLNLRKYKKSKVNVTKKIRTAGGKTVTRKATFARCTTKKT